MNEIPLNSHGDAFFSFPYPSDGPNNAGGIDLVDEPERIVEIKEAERFPPLKRLLTEVNSKDGNLMTLGCDAGPLPDYFAGYFEIAFRDPARVADRTEYDRLLADLPMWIGKILGPEWIKPVVDALAPELEPLRYERKKLHGFRLSIWFRAKDATEAGSLVNLLADFLQEKESPPKIEQVPA